MTAVESRRGLGVQDPIAICKNRKQEPGWTLVNHWVTLEKAYVGGGGEIRKLFLAYAFERTEITAHTNISKVDVDVDVDVDRVRCLR